MGTFHKARFSIFARLEFCLEMLQKSDEDYPSPFSSEKNQRCDFATDLGINLMNMMRDFWSLTDRGRVKMRKVIKIFVQIRQLGQPQLTLRNGKIFWEDHQGLLITQTPIQLFCRIIITKLLTFLAFFDNSLSFEKYRQNLTI